MRNIDEEQIERRVDIVVLASEIKSISKRIDEIHHCLFGNGDYKNNLVIDVQKNTAYRKRREFQRDRSWVFWVAIIAAIAGNLTALAAVFIK
ncbi:MAG: hypothetical protein P9X24_09155 [Candidatus Hatepunaea meridiana]|nr:hypothetical protein [Candidatus Hatepunaea meridiana]